MANKNKSEDQFEQVGEALSKTEKYIVENQKSLTTIIVSVLAIVALFIGYQHFYIKPLEKQAQSDIYMAEIYFEKDSFNLALNGDLNSAGFIDIADDYSSTKTGKLANYYAGLCYLHLGDYENAIEYLEDFSSEDIILSSLSKGCIGDAYMELGEIDNAMDAYEDAINNSNNEFTTTMYMMKLASLYESNQEFKEALDIYQTIKTDFKESREALVIDKYISRVENR